jgi:hypothetical protein
MDDIGFYNKYLLLNNSYLVKHIVWNAVKKNKKSKNINKIIDKELEKSKIKSSINLSKPKVSKLLRSSLDLKKVLNKETNTELTSKCNKETNTEIVNKFDKETNTEVIKSKVKFLNNENGSLINRIKNYKN